MYDKIAIRVPIKNLGREREREHEKKNLNNKVQIQNEIW